MKVLAIIGSPRAKGNSYRLTRSMEEHMKQLGDVEFEYLYLKDAGLEPCRGCYVCLSKGEHLCPIKDSRPMIEEKIMSADGVIFVSPVYVYNISGLMKNLIDRFAYRCHRPGFFKPAVVVSTTGAVGLQFVLFVLGFSVSTWGFSVVHKLGAVTPHDPDRMPAKVKERSEKKREKDAAIAAEKLYRAIKSGPASPGIYGLLQFKLQKDAFSRGQPGSFDNQYWESKGWLDSKAIYYYNVRVNPIKKVIAYPIAKAMVFAMPKPAKVDEVKK